VRHGEAPGVGDPTDWKLDDCRRSATSTTPAAPRRAPSAPKLKAERIPVRRLLASPWCRTLETAALLGVGAVQSEPAFANAFVLSERARELARGARGDRRWRGPGALSS
jgi:broad specificity phosphatase PhoE